MFRTILVPLDGSVFAEHALPLAVSLGRHCGAKVRLLRVVPPLADYLFLPPHLNDPLDAELRQLHRTEARTYLDGVVHRLKDAGVVVCDVMEEEEGISESICADVVRMGVDLIVMTSHGRGALARFWLGSIADKLVRTAPVPVLLARPPEHPPAADLNHAATLKHFLVALGGNTTAERIVEPALAIGKLTGADYTLVRVVRPAFPQLMSSSGAGGGAQPTPSGLGKIDAHNWQKASDYLRVVAERLRAGGATVQTRIHVAEQPAAAILREAAFVGADLIALETHGRGVSRLLIGSVADKVVRSSAVPVLVCRLPNQAG
jgi:nucleotide-binding universal stress UspA family protein